MNESLYFQGILIFILLFSVIIHEVAHGLAAYFQGDKTAYNMGRITLNPIPHIDLIGSILVPAIFLLSGVNAFLAWAKPVPYVPENLKNKKWGELIVAIAGPLSNLILMFLFIVGIFILTKLNIENDFFYTILYYGGFLNLFLAIFNLIPVVPFDGSKVLFSLIPYPQNQKIRNFMEQYSPYIFIILILIIFNTSFIFDFVQNTYNFLLSWI